MLRPLFLLIALAPFPLTACGGADIGESCDEKGSTDECVDNAVCTNEDDGSACRKLCKDKADCPEGEDCNGVSNTSLKSCQPDK
jgi:hypothetical protein